MRVGYLLTSLHPGGAERQMLMLAEHLARDRFAPEIICTSELGPYADHARQKGIRLHTLGRSSREEPGGLRRRLRRSTKALELIRLIRSRRFDVLDAWLYPSYLFVALTRHLTGVGAVVSGRRNLHDLHRPFGPVTGRLNAAANRLTDAVVANADAVARDTREHESLAPDKLRVIRNGVAVPELPTASRIAAMRREIGVAPDDVVIGCVANYRPVKRLDLLIDAVAAIAPGRNVRTVLVGEGPLRQELDARIRQHGLGATVRLHGSALDPTQLLGAFDIAVLTSDSEGLPNVLLEAAAAARPLVATAVGGTPEICVDDVTGMLVDRGDVAGTARALARLVDDADLRRRLGDGARQRAVDAFGIPRMVDEFSSLYESMPGRRRR
jgi:glycosyltransferase involved in cell wall biosynthesis